MKAAAIQMTSGRDYVQNLADAQQWVDQAGRQGVRLVVLPEMFACIGIVNQVELAEQVFTKEKLEETLGAWAMQANLYIVAGSVPYVCHRPDRVYSACFVISPKGKIVAQYNKIHLFDVNVDDEKGSYRESDTFLAGSAPVTTDIDDNKLGLSICYDLRFPELYQAYQQSGCSIITVPSAFTFQTGRQHWEVLLRARAIETQSFVVAANQAGIHQDGRQTWGHSMIIAPSGEVLAELSEDKPGLIIADLDFASQALLKAAMPIQAHKRLMIKS